jgi:hypothetical protein
MNRILPGIQVVAARLNTRRLKVSRACRSLINSAAIYRYPTEEERKIRGEEPIKAGEHPCDALRYLVCGIDRVRELGARAPQVFPPEPEPPPDYETNFRVGPAQQRYQPARLRGSSAEEQFDQSDEARRMNREHLNETFETFGGFGSPADL